MIGTTVLGLMMMLPGWFQQPVNCPGKLSEEQVTRLLEGRKIPEPRVLQYINACGIGFTWSEVVGSRLRQAGATPAVIAAVESIAPKEDLRLKADLALWETVRERRSIAAYQEYLEKFPAGMFASAAKEALEKLKVDEARARAAEEERAAAQRRREEAEAEARRQARESSAEFLKRLNMEFVTIKPGSFTMGSGTADPDEKPVHSVRITKAFEMGKYEVTQAQWEAVMGSNPSYFKGPNLPVERVSWEDVRQFLAKVNEGQNQYRFRLPTEAEWEYAARAGTTNSLETDLGVVAWHFNNSKYETHQVGEKRPNEWGLYDMMGNVWEWCQDWYSKEYYGASPAEDPRGPSGGYFRVARGGSWGVNPALLRVSSRSGNAPGLRGDSIGFRCVREAEIP